VLRTRISKVKKLPDTSFADSKISSRRSMSLGGNPNMKKLASGKIT
jgi:hypothetical protein